MKHASHVMLSPLLALTLLTACAPAAPSNSEGMTSSHAPAAPGASSQEKQLVETYIRANIATLSPKPPVLGGDFTVTDVDFRSGNRAIVQYEDGHIALRGIAVYTVKNGSVSITSFEATEV